MLFKEKTPLAERMRPNNLDEFIGQEHLVGKGKILRSLIGGGHIPSMIFWGPPGVGKTTLAQIISNQSKKPFIGMSAINASVKDVRGAIEKAKREGSIILFIDEIHRFNKSQQDSLLGAVEKGYITLIGATTENPSFEVNHALLSRCQVFVLKELEKKHLLQLLDDALQKDELLKKKKIKLKETDALLRFSGGDARKLLNLLETCVELAGSDKVEISNALVKESIQEKSVHYDKAGEQHYDIISAFIKSIRGSDPNAAIYYLARMVEGGEDPKFIARRLLILASEDIGNANPNALLLANNCFQAVNVIGYPECEIILAQAVVYLATSPKGNSSYMAIKKAKKLVRETGDLQVPLPIRNAPTKLMKDLDYGKDYKYAHDFPGNFVAQEFMPGEISNTRLWDPSDNPRENEMRERMRKLWKKKYGY